MAEFITDNPRPTHLDFGLDSQSGMNAMGQPIPPHRKEAGYAHAKAMGLDREAAFTVVNQVSFQLERDKPYEAMAAGMRLLDLTGTYRLFSVLLTAPLEVPVGRRLED